MADRTSSSIVTSAPRGAVMAVIADFGAYPDWATGVRAAEVVEQGPDGRPSRVRFVLDAGVIKDSYELAYEWDADSGVSWELAQAGTMVTEMSGAYLLTAAADTGAAPGTRVSYELTVGTRMPMIGMLKRRAEKTIIETALKGLKKRAEALPPQDGQEQ
jgi:Polyketide cyclase / dehydrase and lipid transport